MTSQYLLGDELGNIKCLNFTRDAKENKINLETIYKRSNDHGQSSGVQALTTKNINGVNYCAAAFVDGTVFSSSFDSGNTLKILSEWNEDRMKTGTNFIGMSLSEHAAFTCTSNGALRMTPIHTKDQRITTQSASLPTRLHDWKLSPNFETFAYGGDEVDVSVWNTELAFLSSDNTESMAGKKRKRGDALFNGETWRAKNIPNDSLGLRQPIRISSLIYLDTNASTQHLLSGTLLGDVRRYDTRGGRRPVSHWKDIAKKGGVKLVEKSSAEFEVFVSDHGSNLLSVDLRNGRVAYNYKGIAGAITSMSSSPTIMASTSSDHFARIHSISSPNQKGEVLDKVYVNVTPTTVAWNKDIRQDTVVDLEGDDDIWDKMESVNEKD